MRFALVLALLASPAVAQQPPIRMIFDMHVDPVPNGLTLAQKLAVFQTRVGYANWVLDTVAPYGIKVSFLGSGMFMELLVTEGASGNGVALLQRIHAQGGQIGSHAHTEHRAGTLNWPNYTGVPTLPQAIDSWQDNVDWVDQAITLAFAGSPPEPLSAINCVKGSHLPNNEPDFHQLMQQFGFQIRQGGPEEDYYGWYGHHIWNPFRPSSANYMGEDLNGPFVQTTQGSGIGQSGIHHGVFQDMTVPAMKRQFLQLYLNWRQRDRSAAPQKIWTWGWGSHAEDFTPGSSYRGALVEVAPWLELHFANHVEPTTGSDTLLWTTQREAAAAYMNWETANPGVSSFSFDSLAVDWDEYPYLRPVAEELQNFGWTADLALGAGVRAFRLANGADEAVLVWRDSGTSSVDVTGVLDAGARVIGLETGVHYGLNVGAIDVGQEPLLITERDRCTEPVSYCTSTLNSSGVNATIAALGTTSVAANDFALQVSGCPASVSALFFYGPGTKLAPFGDGHLCVKGPVIRLGPLASTSAGGVLTRALDLPSLAQPIVAGSIWNFQGWYRDGAAGGSGFNSSDALNLQFCP